MRVHTTAMAAAVAVTVISAGCSGGDSEPPRRTAVPISGVDTSGTSPGSLVSASTIPYLDGDVAAATSRAMRIVYRSTYAPDGHATEVSGFLLLPNGTPPAGGWPVLAFAHGTSGIQESCAPSLSGELGGAGKQLSGYLASGVAVVATDYQGLGMPGVHPYLDAATAGLNVIDSVRAARRASHDVGAVWVAYGPSQGGSAVWAANEESAAYAPDLNLRGTVSVVPPADISGLVDLAVDRRMSRDQAGAYVAVVDTVSRTHPDVVVDDYRRGAAKSQWGLLTSCDSASSGARTTALDHLDPADLAPANAAAAQRLRAVLQQMALPVTRAAAPMRVYYAGADTFIDPQWTAAAITRACGLGSRIETTFSPRAGHSGVNDYDATEWMAQRLGNPAQIPAGCSETTRP